MIPPDKSALALSLKKRQAQRYIHDKPTALEWADMPKSRSCTQSGPDGKKQVFHSGQDVLVLGHPMKAGRKYQDHEYWVAQLIEFAFDWDMQVWVCVQWYWSGKDISEASHGRIDTRSYAKYERSPSEDITDIISLDSVIKTVIVREFDEHSIDQDPFSANSFFWRRRFYLCQTRTSPRVRESATCFCKRPYSPDRDVMRFCPRPGCCKWYHASCLAARRALFAASAGTPDTPPPAAGDYAAALVRNAPDRDGFDADALTHPRVTGADAALLVRVWALAAQPVVRGPGYGVVGNAQRVVAARRWVRRCQSADPRAWAMEVGGEMVALEEWLDEMDVHGLLEDEHPWKRAVRKVVGEYVCVKCRNAI